MSRTPASTTPLHVIVVGGGIGGLCLAQGLARAGVSVSVHERDRAPTAREQGYRIHIDPTGSRSLHECLPPALWDTFVATAGDPGTAGFGFLTEQLRTLVLVEDEIFRGGATGAAVGHHAVSRITLRQILLAGLGDVVHFDKEFLRYELAPGARVRALFSDGSTALGDLLVGADGASSRVRQQYLPSAERVDTGAVGIGGKIDLTERTQAWLPTRITTGMNIILGHRDFLFTAVFNRRRTQQQARELLGDDLRAVSLDPDLLLANFENRDYAQWAFVTHSSAFPIDADGRGLQDLVRTQIKTWHPDLRRLVAETDPTTVNAFPFRTSVRPTPWQSTNVTLLGDAIHSMPPTGGVGANTALRDATVLCRALTAVHRDDQPLLAAVAAYEAQMLHYAFDAVGKSMRYTRLALANPLARAGARGFVRACGLVPPLRRAVFKDNWPDTADRPSDRAEYVE